MDSMNLLAGDRVSPFPDSGNLLFAAGLLSNHHSPQKLIPVRSIPPPPPPGFHGHSPLHPPPPCAKSEDPSGSGSGHSSLPLGQEPGSSLDDVGNSSASTKEFESRKRRKKTARKLEDFAANLVKKMTEKQEKMHSELVEMIEKMEKERVEREEAWRREEMERIKQDEEARAAERSRSLALVSLIQKLLGHEIQIPPPAEGSGVREEEEVEVNNNNNNSQPLTHCMGSAEVNNNSLALIQYVGPAEVSNNKKDSNSGDPSSNRWPDVEVQALIGVRTAFEHRFGHMGSKGSIWEEISGALQGMGYNRSAKKCKEKWENINKYYRRTVGSGKKRPVNSKTCPYFDELDNLYRNGSFFKGLGKALSNTNNVSMSEEKEQEFLNEHTEGLKDENWDLDFLQLQHAVTDQDCPI